MMHGTDRILGSVYINQLDGTNEYQVDAQVYQHGLRIGRAITTVPEGRCIAAIRAARYAAAYVAGLGEHEAIWQNTRAERMLQGTNR